MTAITTDITTDIPVAIASEPAAKAAELPTPTRTPTPLPPPAWTLDPARPLIERLAARISAGLDEIAVFASAEDAAEAVACALLSARRVVLATPANDAVAAASRRAAASVREFDLARGDAPLDGLVAAARDAETVVLSSPVCNAGGARATLAPRDLLRLRSRATRPALVLDLTGEELAAEPLTQTALLLPGTVAIRAFGPSWREVGARGLAGIAFVVGPREFIDLIGRNALTADAAEAACRDLDSENIERAARAAARSCREAAACG